MSGAAYSPGDLLVDRDAEPDERGTMVVLRYVRDEQGSLAVAAAHEFEAGTTVADVNPDRPADDLVVEVAFEGWLDSVVGEAVDGWRGLLMTVRERPDATFYGLLSAYCHEWGVPRRTYSYPESRLMPRPFCRACHERAEWVAETASYACVTPSCESPDVTAGETLNALDEPQSADDGHESNGQSYTGP